MDRAWIPILLSILTQLSLLLLGHYLWTCGFYPKDYLRIGAPIFGSILLYDFLKRKFPQWKWLFVVLICVLHIILGVIYYGRVC